MWRHVRPEAGAPFRVLVRHADAGLRSTWSGPDEWRGLTDLGHAQAAAVAAKLRDLPILRILSSPSLRCRQTAVPIARELSLEVEPCWQLKSDVHLRHLLRLLGDCRTDSAVLCTHRETLQLLLADLAQLGAVTGDETAGPMAMAAVWILSGTLDDTASVRLEYLSPTAAVPRLR
jgi:phosphohistidine phosphatase SixA